MVKNGGKIEDLFSGGNMANIMQSISSKLTSNQDGLDTNNLLNEATNICNSMQGNPLFSSLMGMQGDIFNTMDQENKEEETTKKIELSNNSDHNPNKVKERLQKKLKDKKKQKELIVKKE